MTPRRVELALLKLLEQRYPKTACPSEVARLLDKANWRGQMQPVRDAAVRLQKRGRVEVLQRGKSVDPAIARGPIRVKLAPKAEPYRGIDFRLHPERYRIGRGEQGVLTAEPYKSELLPLWRFKNEVEAKRSSKALFSAFCGYRRARDFVGMDMARKFVQMGYTRARRYANHKSGRKYDTKGAVAPLASDPEKAKAALVFQSVWKKIAADPAYVAARARFKAATRVPPA